MHLQSQNTLRSKRQQFNYYLWCLSLRSLRIYQLPPRETMLCTRSWRWIQYCTLSRQQGYGSLERHISFSKLHRNLRKVRILRLCSKVIEALETSVQLTKLRSLLRLGQGIMLGIRLRDNRYHWLPLWRDFRRGRRIKRWKFEKRISHSGLSWILGS